MSSSPTLVNCTHIGSLAHELLSSETSVHVAGITSRGVFLKTSSRWIIFISTERFRGPLTLNLAEDTAPALKRMTPESKGLLTPDGILFPNLRVSTANAIIWQPPPKPPSPGLTAAVLEQARALALAAHRSKNGAGLSSLIPALLNPDSNPTRPYIGSVNVRHIQDKFAAGLYAVAAEHITGVLGFGSGLTPSGDDFTIGILLAFSRWGDVLSPEQSTYPLNNHLIQAAYQKTTTISANLIECAARGLADERLIAALDNLMSAPHHPAHNVLQELLGWGNSSGLDALTGMLTALLARFRT